MSLELPLLKNPINAENPIVYLDIAIGAEKGSNFNFVNCAT